MALGFEGGIPAIDHAHNGQISNQINDPSPIFFVWAVDRPENEEFVDHRYSRTVMRTLAPISPGEMLDEGFFKSLGLSKYRLVKDIGVPPPHIGDIVAGKRAVTTGTDLCLCRYFGLGDGWWLRGQDVYDTAVAKEALREELSRIPRCPLSVA